MTREIRRTKVGGLYGAIAAAACFLAGAFLFGSEGVFFLLGAVYMVVYGIAIDRNDRVAYDEAGITFYTIWGRPIPYPWSQAAIIDTAVEQLVDRRFIVGLILRIHIADSDGTITVYRFPLNTTKGSPNSWRSPIVEPKNKARSGDAHSSRLNGLLLAQRNKIRRGRLTAPSGRVTIIQYKSIC